MSEAVKPLQDKFRGLRDLAVRVSHLQSRHDHPLQSQGGQQPEGRGLVVVAKDGGVSEGVAEHQTGHPGTASSGLRILLA